MVGRAADNNDHSDGGFDSLEHPGGLSSLRRVRHLARASDRVEARRHRCGGPPSRRPRQPLQAVGASFSACARSTKDERADRGPSYVTRSRDSWL